MINLKLVWETIIMAGKRPRVVVTQESDSGRNLKFHNNNTGQDMSRRQFVREIEQGRCKGYHVRNINGVKTPAANPNDRDCDNLG